MKVFIDQLSLLFFPSSPQWRSCSTSLTQPRSRRWSTASPASAWARISDSLRPGESFDETQQLQFCLFLLQPCGSFPDVFLWHARPDCNTPRAPAHRFVSTPQDATPRPSASPACPNCLRTNTGHCSFIYFHQRETNSGL